MSDKIYAECLFEANGGGVSTDSSLKTVVGGIAPKSCRNLTCEFDDDNDVLKFKWEDVDDTYWGGVRLVIKKDSAPENFEDGDIIEDIYECNAHKTVSLDIPIVDSGTYYATLFPFSTTGCVNPLKVSHMDLDVINTLRPVSFAEDSWDTIFSIIEEGTASTYYNVGDTKQLTCSDGNTYTMEIAKYESINSEDGEKTTMLLIAKELCNDVYTDIGTCNGAFLGWSGVVHDSEEDPSCICYNYPNIDDIASKAQDLFDIIPSNISSHIKSVKSSLKYGIGLNVAQAAYYTSGQFYSQTTLSSFTEHEFNDYSKIVIPSIYNKEKKIINTETFGSYFYNDYKRISVPQKEGRTEGIINADFNEDAGDTNTNVKRGLNGGQNTSTFTLYSYLAKVKGDGITESNSIDNVNKLLAFYI